jgi:hypothetical protein
MRPADRRLMKQADAFLYLRLFKIIPCAKRVGNIILKSLPAPVKGLKEIEDNKTIHKNPRRSCCTTGNIIIANKNLLGQLFSGICIGTGCIRFCSRSNGTNYITPAFGRCSFVTKHLF